MIDLNHGWKFHHSEPFNLYKSVRMNTKEFHELEKDIANETGFSIRSPKTGKYLFFTLIGKRKKERGTDWLYTLYNADRSLNAYLNILID